MKTSAAHGLPFRQIHDHNSCGDANLDGGQSDTRCVVHGVEHVRDQGADVAVDGVDGPGDREAVCRQMMISRSAMAVRFKD